MAYGIWYSNVSKQIYSNCLALACQCRHHARAFVEVTPFTPGWHMRAARELEIGASKTMCHSLWLIGIRIQGFHQSAKNLTAENILKINRSLPRVEMGRSSKEFKWTDSDVENLILSKIFFHKSKNFFLRFFINFYTFQTILRNLKKNVEIFFFTSPKCFS